MVEKCKDLLFTLLTTSLLPPRIILKRFILSNGLIHSEIYRKIVHTSEIQIQKCLLGGRWGFVVVKNLSEEVVDYLSLLGYSVW